MYLLLFLRLEVRLDNKPVHGHIDNEGPYGGIKHGAGKELIGQVDREEICLAGSIQPGTKKKRNRLMQGVCWRPSEGKIHYLYMLDLI